MTAPRGLTPAEAALWRKVADTVTPLEPTRIAPLTLTEPAAVAPAPAKSPPKFVKPTRRTPAPVAVQPARSAAPPRELTRAGLDGSWDRKLAKAEIAPDLTIDLHGHSLDSAYALLMDGLSQASAMRARLVLLVTGKHRPHGDHDARGSRRGAIRAKLLDWLAASPHASRIAAVRPAHPRHGGAGAVYIVLRR